MGRPQALPPSEPLPLYGVPLDVECLRVTGGSRHSVRTSRERLSGRMVTSVSAEAAVAHYRGAGRLDVLTFAPADSMNADYLLFREPGSRQHGPSKSGEGTPLAAMVLIDGAPVRFSGYQVPGLAVLLAKRAGHAVGIISRGWPLAEISLATITDTALYESLELEDARIMLRGAQAGRAADPVVIYPGQPDDYVHTDGAIWTWRKRWRLVAGIHLRMYDLLESPSSPDARHLGGLRRGSLGLPRDGCGGVLVLDGQGD